MQPQLTRLCLDCGRLDDDVDPAVTMCLGCGSSRLIAHDELRSLSVAHADCGAYYASIEKRDHPELANQPLIVGGGERGVVMKPDMVKYQRESRRIRELMWAATPLVEAVSIDEAYLDLSQASAR
ncbi:MAG: polymerase [Rhodospirillales bacterium]|nr:polymerase [Rhodospirillales bacterium]